MQQTFGDPESGLVRLTQRDRVLFVTLHWPFDRETDEWIDVSSRFPLEGGSEAPNSLPSSLLLQGPDSKVAISEAKADRYRFSITGTNAAHPVEADIFLPRSIGEPLVAALAQLGFPQRA